MHNATTIQQLKHMLGFLSEHQVLPAHNTPGEQNHSVRYSAFETFSGHVAYLGHVQVETYDGVDEVKALMRVNSTYSEYRPAPDVYGVAFGSYLQLSVVDALCSHVNAFELSWSLKDAKQRYQKFDLDKWFLDLMIGAHKKELQCSEWNMHKKTLDTLIRMRSVHGDIFVLDMLYSDYNIKLPL